MLKIPVLLIMSFNYSSEHFRKKTSKRSIFDCFARLWRFGHISLVRTPIDAIQDVPESQQTGLQLCSFEYLRKTTRATSTRDLRSRG
jgi:hypothetical protein